MDKLNACCKNKPAIFGGFFNFILINVKKGITAMFEQFIEDFLSINPHPTQQQVEWLKQSIGVSDFDCPDFCSEVLGQAYKRAKLCALTESERVLINDYNPALTETDNLLINDGDNFTPPEKLGNQDALRVDGIEEDNPSIQELEVYNAGN